MRTYDFEYTDQKLLHFLTLGCFALLLILAFGLNYLDPTSGVSENGAEYRVLPSIPIFVKIAFAFGIPGLIFLLNYKKITKAGTAYLSDNALRLDLDGQEMNTEFRDLASYRMEYFNGPRLTLKLRDGKKIKIVAHKNYCHAKPFEFVCDSLEYDLDQYAAKRNVGLVREPSLFAQKWMIAALITLLLVAVAGLYYAFFTKQGLAVLFILPLSFAIPLWQAYFKVQRKQRARLA